MTQLLKVEPETRDSQWELQFLNFFPQNSLYVPDPDVKQGPDGFAYLLAQTTEDGTPQPPTDTQEQSVSQVMEWLHERGVGLVINAHKKYPDYIFNYGMIWSFKENGFFHQVQIPEQDNSSSQKKSKDKTISFKDGEQFYIGEPSQEYLPQYVRDLMIEFFKQQGVKKPRVAVLRKTEATDYDLCFSVESLGDPPKKEHDGIAQALSWFLPLHYSVMLISEKGLADFFDL